MKVPAPLRKIDALIGETPSPFDYGNIFARARAGDKSRLIIGFDQAQDGCVRELAAGLSGPFQLLYVLHTSRTDATLGRYASPELTVAEVNAFLNKFGRFLSEDARHDFWVRSHDDDGTIVLDRHNIIYAYGPLEAFERVLLKIGGQEGSIPQVPHTHAHYYHAEWDTTEREVLAAFPWALSPLRDSDIQYKG